MARVNLDQQAKIRVAQDAAVPLVRRTVTRIRNGAQLLVPRGSHMSGSGERHPGQPLRSSFYTAFSVGNEHVTGVVGANAEHALTVHQGSSPHIIRGRAGLLKFQWERGQFLVFGPGGHRRPRVMFYFPQVNHPGNKRPVRYLTTPLHMFGRLEGFRTTSTPASRSRLP